MIIIHSLIMIFLEHLSGRRRCRREQEQQEQPVGQPRPAGWAGPAAARPVAAGAGLPRDRLLSVEVGTVRPFQKVGMRRCSKRGGVLAHCPEHGGKKTQSLRGGRMGWKTAGVPCCTTPARGGHICC